MTKIFLIITMVISFEASAQTLKVNLQASGLTCSLCSNAINKALQTLDFVDRVEANIKNSSFDISFKPGKTVDYDKLKMKIEGAGFSVAHFTATLHFDHITVANDDHVTVNGMVFHFLNVSGQLLDGDKTVRLLDKGFVSTKEYKKNSSLTRMECYKTGVAGACCTKDHLTAGTRIFHVTI